MPPDPDRRLRPRMTIRQIGVLVVFAAVASAVAMPQIRMAENRSDLPFQLVMEVPYALILPALFLIRRGAVLNWLVSALCCLPLLGFLAFVHLARAPAPLFLFVIVDVGIGLMLIYFGRWLIPRVCPTCGWWALLRDGSVPHSSRFRAGSNPRTCLACGSRFRRNRLGPWVDVDIPGNVPAKMARV